MRALGWRTARLRPRVGHLVLIAAVDAEDDEEGEGAGEAEGEEADKAREQSVAVFE